VPVAPASKHRLAPLDLNVNDQMRDCREYMI
jgi:hypothetical protein